MNPLFQKIVGGIVRALLASALVPLVTWLTAHGYINGTDTEKFITWFAGVVMIIVWSLVQKRTEQLKLLVAASTHAVLSEQEIERHISLGREPVPALTTKKDQIPVPSSPATFGR